MFNKLLQFFMLMVDGGEGGGGADDGKPADGGGKPADGGGGAAPWYDGFKDPVVKDWLKAYGTAYPDPEAVAMKALNLEKFIGADKAGRGIIIPKADAKPEEWRAFYAKVGGVPEKVDGYKVPEAMAKDPFIAKFREHAHKIGMPVSHFDSMVSWIGTESAAFTDVETREFEQRATQEMEQVRTDWGNEYDAKTEAGQRAARIFIPGTPEEREEILTRMEGALGAKVTMNLWASIGAAISEHGYVAGDTASTGGMTPEAARVRIETLKKDAE